ncbi:MAG TPA: SgcJ/EcaC family oxidoreductase [Burkholderiales bacterium]|nr:SgcJ/EcaC family oxidoreductase [Burkholderiales bacterium]
MTRENSKTADEAAIRTLIDAITKAVRAKDVEAMLAQCAPDIVIFDMVPPLKHQGSQAIRGLWARTLAAFDPPLEYEVHDLDISVDGDVAFARCLNRFGGTKKDARRVLNSLRSTFGLRKIDGQWKVVHEHVSVPFEMETGKAMLDLKP